MQKTSLSQNRENVLQPWAAALHPMEVGAVISCKIFVQWLTTFSPSTAFHKWPSFWCCLSFKWPKSRIYWQSLVSTCEYHKCGSKLLNIIQMVNYLKKLSLCHFRLRVKITGFFEQVLPFLVPFLHLSNGDNFSSLSWKRNFQDEKWLAKKSPPVIS